MGNTCMGVSKDERWGDEGETPDPNPVIYISTAHHQPERFHRPNRSEPSPTALEPRLPNISTVSAHHQVPTTTKDPGHSTIVDGFEKGSSPFTTCLVNEVAHVPLS